MMRWLILSADMISPAPNMKINKSDRFRTVLGGLVSIIAYICMIGISAYFISVLSARSQSNLIYGLVQKNDDLLLNLSNTPFTYGFYDFYANPLKNISRYLRVDPYLLTRTPGPNTTVITTKIPIVYEPCDLNTNLAPYSEYYKDNPLVPGINCPKLGQNITMFGYGAQISGYSNIFIDVFRCTNTTTKTDCYPQDQINSYLNSFYIVFTTLSYSLNHSNVDTPGSLYLKDDVLPFSASMYYAYLYSWRTINYVTDMGLVFESNIANKYYTVLDYTVGSDLRSQTGSQIGRIYFHNDKPTENYVRSYQKAQATLAQIGGVLKAILTVAQILTSVFTSELYYLELISSVFNINNSRLEKEVVKPKMRKMSIVQKKETNNLKSPAANNLNSDENKNLQNEGNKFTPKTHVVKLARKKSLVNEKAKTHMKISFFNMLMPVFCFIGASRMRKLNYVNLKSFIINKLCIKQMLIRTNEVEKLALLTLDDSMRKEFEGQNPFPNNKDAKSLWEDFKQTKA